MSKVPSIEILRAGLELMRRNGKPLKQIDAPGRSMLYVMPNGETVRARTSNDHILIAIAKSPSIDAALNIEGTDWLLIAMLEIERTPGKVLSYLVPTKVAVEAAREAHRTWLKTNPNTKGSNTTWNLWFGDGTKDWENFAKKWAQYRLNGEVSILQTSSVTEEFDKPKNVDAPASDFRSEIEAARRRISSAAGVSLDAVKITIEFGL